ncbi:ATP-binding protein [Pseudomonas nitroreducens]|uniref:AAA family ATPase n=2 Tax=Pseudomonas nitroreducens TaxID=46680 RepID=UPI0014751630|nr:ATP-binding protein [Pseudomonas nitroreducens]MDG9855723.1 ATP-binding protein [Pseudomonas nitroreducens]NMZ74062.1 ATP-binding protein [Pseudomonas nitroreducens]
MRRGLSRQRGAVSYKRLLVIASVTFLLVSAVLAPRLNPFTRDAALGNAAFEQFFGEMAAWRTAMMEAQQIEGHWPENIQAFAPSIEHPALNVVSPQPQRLLMTVADRSEMGDLAGKQVIVDMPPRSSEWSCRPGSPPVPSRYLMNFCLESGDKASNDSPLVENLRWLVIICALLFVIAALLLLFRHPLLGPVQLRPQRLLDMPLADLPRVDRLLGLLGRRRATLRAAGIEAQSWQQALAYVGAEAEQRAQALALALGASCQVSWGWSLPGRVFEWKLPEDVPVSLDRCLVYVPATEENETRVLQHLRVSHTGLDVMLVLLGERQEQLLKYCADTANLCVAIDAREQTQWLLGGNPGELLLRLLAAQLRLTRISPYQTRGGVVRASSFFGRDQLLARVLNREPANYLVVGGRQLGKSSLLKAVQRRLEDHPQVVCHYVSLRDHRLTPRLALQFGLPAESTLEAIIEHINTQQLGKRLFLLIDEADLFFRDEAAKGYPQLSTLRALSEEGRCWFMLAGFWDLYATAVLDYQSPLRNFGEVLTIGALERQACRELASVPLSRLRLGFASDTLLEDLVDASGQRANLVAILCQECLEALPPGARVIERLQLKGALASQAVQDALAGWGRLSQDETACRLDRIIVYHCAQHAGTGLAALIELFGERIDAVALKASLARLQLAFVLKRSGDGYAFAVPLFAGQFEAAELPILLRHELSTLERDAR